MDKSAKTKLVSDIESRLDDFFGEQSEASPPAATHHSIEKLKSAVLSIDWEITDGCLSDLIGETEALLPKFEDNPIAYALLRMLRALGRYIRKHKAQAHQDAIKRVMSAFASFEMIVEENNQLEEQQKKKIVAKEIQAFKKLKENVEVQRQPEAAPVQEQPSAEKSDIAGLQGHQHFKQAMLEMEERLSMEVKSLKSQLAALQREIDALRKD